MFAEVNAKYLNDLILMINITLVYAQNDWSRINCKDELNNSLFYLINKIYNGKKRINLYHSFN